MATLITIGALSATASGRDGWAIDKPIGAIDIDSFLSTGNSGSVDVSVRASLPAVSATGNGIVGTANSIYHLNDLALSAIEAGGSNRNQSLPALEASGLGIGGASVAVLEAEIPAFNVAGVGATGQAGRANVVLPSIEAHGFNQSYQTDLPAVDAVGTGLSSPHVLSVSLAIPAIDIADSSGYASTIGEASLSLPGISVAGTGAQQAKVTALKTGLPVLVLSGTGIAGGAGHARLVVPTIEAAGRGGVAVIGTASFAIGAIDAHGIGHSATVEPTFGMALNTTTRAASEYADVPFNSLTEFNGVLLAAGSGGLFAIDASSDDGTEIDSRIRSAKTDFGLDNMKRVREVFLGVSSSGTLELTVILEGGCQQFYPVYPNHPDELATVRAKIGRGMKSRYWQWELASVDGSDFRLADLTMPPEVLSRKLA